jgi:phosphoribosylglycinamide formyltransferase-1
MLEEKMEKIRIAVLVSGGGTNLQALLDKQGTEILDGEIVLVLSNNANAYALERAKKAGVSTAVVVKKELGSQEAFENAMLAVLAEYKVDFIVMAGFLTILSENFTNAYKNRIINVHPSLIPKYAGEGFYGLKVHEAVLAAGEKVTGATVHFVNEIPDGGEIILQKEVAVEPGDTPESLQKRVMEAAEWILLPKAVQTVCERMRKGEKR